MILDDNSLMFYFVLDEKRKIKIMNKLFTPLSEYDISNLTDDWVFTSLIDFIDNVQRGGIIDYDGFGEFIFVDKQGQLCLKESAHFYPTEIMATIKEIKRIVDYILIMILQQK